MVSQHRDRTLNVRPATEAREAAEAVLAEHQRDMTSFITACLATLAAEPDKMLRAVAKQWPAPKPMGRPPAAKAAPVTAKKAAPRRKATTATGAA